MSTFEKIYRRFYWPLVYFASKIVSFEDAEEIVDDLMEKVSKEQFLTEKDVKDFRDFRVKNKCIERLRKEKN